MSTERVYCHRCHREAARVERTEEAVKIIQGRTTLITLGGGSKNSAISVKCPHGHPVAVKF